ncbi:hypothetical protein Pelo_19461 [Pelomyxa schiedti]|nr:hypothetical protein Pelo_19461 [Pelomyxa schiedti]
MKRSLQCGNEEGMETASYQNSIRTSSVKFLCHQSATSIPKSLKRWTASRSSSLDLKHGSMKAALPGQWEGIIHTEISNQAADRPAEPEVGP